MTDELVLEERIAEGTATILLLTLNRGDDRNPFDRDTVQKLSETLDHAARDRKSASEPSTGSGPAFSAGGDMKGYVSLYRDPAAFRAFQEDFANLVRLPRAPRPPFDRNDQRCVRRWRPGGSTCLRSDRSS